MHREFSITVIYVKLEELNKYNWKFKPLRPQIMTLACYCFCFVFFILLGGCLLSTYTGFMLALA